MGPARLLHSRLTPLTLPGAALAVLSCAAPASRSGSAAGDRLAPLRREDAVWLERVSFGLESATVADYRRLGRERYLEEQLHGGPAEDLPPPIAAQIQELSAQQAAPERRLQELQERRKTINAMADGPAKEQARKLLNDEAGQSAYRAIRLELLRAVYSPAQLREQMVWFWLNHFSVFQYKADLRWLISDYEEQAIRPYALGRFHDLVLATLEHPAMLQYLDNSQNAAGHINENYARELMELHTLGVNGGYSQQDVQQLARVLTGVGVNAGPAPHLKPEWRDLYVRRGAFEFNPARHDYSDKQFLGHTIKGRGLAEVDEALDILVHHPATATHLSRQIATYFASDNPPDALVRKMAQTFASSNGDIAAVLSTMVHAVEFSASLKPGTRFKDPVQYVLSAVRLAYDNKVILSTTPIQGWLNRMGEGLFNHETPDGYPMTSASWNGPGQMLVRFEVARAIGSSSAGLFKPDGPNAVDQPAFPLIQNALYFNGLKRTLGPSTLAALDKAISPQDWNTLYLSSPEFMH